MINFSVTSCHIFCGYWVVQVLEIRFLKSFFLTILPCLLLGMKFEVHMQQFINYNKFLDLKFLNCQHFGAEAHGVFTQFLSQNLSFCA